MECFRSFPTKSERPTKDLSTCAVRSTREQILQLVSGTHHSSESSAVWACLASQMTNRTWLYVVQRYHHKILHVLNSTLATINHEPALCFFTFGPIYKPRAWPLLFTYVSIDIPWLSPVVLGVESLLRLDRLCSPVKIFNKTDVWGTWIHNFLFISHCHGFMESFQKSVYKILYFVNFWGYFVTFILGYISSTTWSYTKLRFVPLKILCIVIFPYVHNYLILFLFLRMSRKFLVLAQ